MLLNFPKLIFYHPNLRIPCDLRETILGNCLNTKINQKETIIKNRYPQNNSLQAISLTFPAPAWYKVESL